MRLRIACVLLLFPLLAGAAPKRSAPKEAAAPIPPLPWDQLDGVAAEWNKARDEIEPLLGKLKTLQGEYARPVDYKDLLTRRMSLCSSIQQLYEQLDVLDERYREIQKAIQIQAVPLAFTSVNKKDFHAASGREMVRALQAEGAFKEMSLFSRRVRDVRNEDQSAWDAAESARKNRRLVTWISASAAVVGVVILALFLWGWRNKQASVTIIPAMVQGQVTTPGQPPSFLSGPAGGVVSGPPRISGPVGAPLAGQALPAPAMPDVLGGNFKIAREIGQGGMGIVYEAMDLTLQRKVAIKRMRAEVMQNKRELEMFLSEARLVASLKHPNLVEIHSIMRESEQLFLIFEYVSGRPLHQILEDGRTLPYHQIKAILRPVAHALDYAHSKRVIHRDLKPSNIMITEEGQVKVMDFGIAHQAKKTVAKLTRADAWGTPPYMAPEQELGQVSKESDFYSLGVCYYEMLTGQLPFPGPNFLAQKREMAYEAPTKTGPRLHPKTDEVMRRALQADPRLRFHTGAEFIAAVESVPAA
ncbi:MAG: serine/threonine-protein kinase [Elusimicrobiota bacterium]